MGQLIVGDLCWFPHLDFPEPGPEMEKRLLEMYREWVRGQGKK